ncbi:DNA polymerase III subunit gamma/tau [uncultured Gardnerella sp.]|uniref:DNA polymerase III subunit gamma/tau n=1 Tax=uncultured Gardnerella sp. TaxID=293424 RepID=UPI0025D5E7C0|nr:DNA polymerase III subunit gamma/tau [uncultured Gardnerella sp.]
MALALYRRYRPDTFDGLIGQDQVTIPLCRALDQGKITHAYLFSGPRGCGKTSSARILARCINCEKGPTSHPCGECQSCKDLATGGSGSVDVVEIDAASHNGVDDARELRERAGFAPARDRYKIFILDEAHMVTPQGFNALLKIVEEPPEHVMFIFATTEPDKVIGTIRSRTHHYPFRLVPPEIMGPYLEEICKKEKIESEPGVLRLAMRAGGGSMRDTLSILDQLMLCAVDGKISLDSAVALLGFTPSSLIGEVIDALINHDGAKLYDLVSRVIVSGFDSRKFVEDLLGRMRDLLLVVSAGVKATSSLLNDLAPDELTQLKRQSEELDLVDLSRMAQMTNSALSEMSSAVSPRMNLEILMSRLLCEKEDRLSSSKDSHKIQEKKPSGFVQKQRKQIASEPKVSSTQPSKKQLSTDEMWDNVVASLPEDVKEYVSRDFVTKVRLVQSANNKQRLVLTFNKPISQYAFALAICTTDPYEGQKVPVVVMNAVKREFGENCMIAPDSVTSDGETVEVVTKMSSERLSQVKREVLMRRAGSVTGFGSSSLSVHDNTKQKDEKLESNFHSADGYAASAESNNTAEIRTILDSNDAWENVSSMPVLGVNTVNNVNHDNAYNASSNEDLNNNNYSRESNYYREDNYHESRETRVISDNIENSANRENSNNYRKNMKFGDSIGKDSAYAAYSAESKESTESLKSSKSSESDSSNTVNQNSSSSLDDLYEYSLEDRQLESVSGIDEEGIEKMFEVKEVREFSSEDSQNPINLLKKKSSKNNRSKEK